MSILHIKLFFKILISVDTVKTRLQGQPYSRLQKYSSMVQAYKLIFRQEGVMKGLYAGVSPAMIGSRKAVKKTIFVFVYFFLTIFFF